MKYCEHDFHMLFAPCCGKCGEFRVDLMWLILVILIGFELPFVDLKTGFFVLKGS